MDYKCGYLKHIYKDGGSTLLRIIARCLLAISTALPVIMMGCSGGGLSNTTPEAPPSSPNPNESAAVPPFNSDGGSERMLLGLWQFYFDPASLSVEAVPLRNADPHYDITKMLLPPICGNCLSIKVNSFFPISRVLDVDVTLRNPYPVPGHDVRGILYTNDQGHRLLNPDAWTALYDIPGGDPINPFRAFAKKEAKRTFGTTKTYTEKYYIYIPIPAHYEAITYAADGCWLGNCSEPYAIENFDQLNPLGDSIGATADLEVYVHDWQNNTNKVSISVPEITGEQLTPFDYVGDDKWRMTITVNVDVKAGPYVATIMASSSDSGDIALYRYVTIIITAAEPVVLGIDPDNGPANTSLAGVIVSGQQFQGPGASVKLIKPGSPDMEASNVNVVDGSQITCDITIPITAPLGKYNVQVTNGNGLSHTAYELFEVICPAPIVQGIQPDNGLIETKLTGVTITGDNFIGPDSTVKMRMSGHPDISATNVVVVNGQTITCDFTITCIAVSGMYDIQVTNACSSSGTGAGLFEVSCPSPMVNTITPNKGDVGGKLTGVVISGSEFLCDTASIELTKTGAPDIPGLNIDIINKGTIICDFNIPTDAPIGLYNIRMTNGCQSSNTKSSAFEVVCPMPTTNSVSIPHCDAGAGLTGLLIDGNKFMGPSLDVILKRKSAPDIAASNIIVLDSNTICCDLDIPLEAPIGLYDIEITNGCGTKGTGVNLFEVTCPVPVVTSIVPDNWVIYPGQPINDAVIIGSGFIPCDGVTSVYIDNGEYKIYATDIKVLSNYSLTCDFNIQGYTYEFGEYDLVVVTQQMGIGKGLFAIYNNILFQQNFSAGDGACIATGTHGGYNYCGMWWDSYYPWSTPYPTKMYSAFMTPEFDVPSFASDVHFRMLHSIDTDILEGAVAGWTNNDGGTFWGDVLDGVNHWYFEAGQDYNGDDFYSPIYEGLGAYIGCTQVTGWANRYWLGSFGSVGGTVWSKFHCTGSANLIGMSNARFMVVFLSDSYVEHHRGHEISDLIIWYDPPK